MKNFIPEVGIILGSGLSGVVKEVEVLQKIPYSKMRDLHMPKVQGHAGELVLGYFAGRRVALFSGRSHFYEGVSMEALGVPVRKIRSMGAKFLILTMAAGSLRRDFRPGDLVLVKDHINWMGVNPLRGVRSLDGSTPFLDMVGCYSKRLQQIAISVAKEKKISLRSGVYVAVSGPTYETSSEVNLFRKFGGDIVGMSLVPESVVAHLCGLETLAIGAVTNLASGLGTRALSHLDVLSSGSKIEKSLTQLLNGILPKI